LFDICNRCHRKHSFSVLPDKEKLWFIKSIIPERFVEAEMEHLPEKLIEKIKALTNGTGLLLWGAPGVGKTYAMAALAKHYITEGFIVQRIGYEMLCLQIRDTFKPTTKNTEYEILLPYLKAGKLFVEDIGTTKSEGNIESDFSIRTLLVLLDYRLEHCQPTFFTTNRPIEELEQTFDARIASRLVQCCEVVKLSGDDKRFVRETVK